MIDRFEKFSLAIAEIYRYWHKLASEELSVYGLKGSHATYLTALYRYDEGITVPELCEVCGKDKSDASRMIAILEKKGLVTKQAIGGSNYRGKLFLTNEGKQAAKSICDTISRAVEVAGKDLSNENRDIFYEALESITSNMRKLSKEGIPK